MIRTIARLMAVAAGLIAPSAIIAVATPATSSARGEFRDFQDWVSVCDNGLRCQVSSTMGQVRNISDHIQIRREAGPQGRIEIDLWSNDRWPDGVASLHIDGQVFRLARADAQLRVRPEASAAAARALADGRSIELRIGGERSWISAHGSAAALRDMDARQGRAGTVTAIVARGGAPATAVPPAPALPVRTEAYRPARGPVIRPSPELIARWRRAEECDAQLDPRLYPVQSWPVDRRTAVILVMCYPGGHNSFVLVKVGTRPDGSDARPATFDARISLSERSGPSVPPDNPYRADNGRLASRQNGAIAYPSADQEWVWDGRRFRLIQDSGSDGSTFRARVRQLTR